jgi:hypothetical protein
VKAKLQFPEGPLVDVDITKRHGAYAVHRAFSGSGWAVTDVKTFRLVGWYRTQQEAKAARRELEQLLSEELSSRDQNSRTISR